MTCPSHIALKTSPRTIYKLHLIFVFKLFFWGNGVIQDYLILRIVVNWQRFTK